MNGSQRKAILTPFINRWDGVDLYQNGVLGPNPYGAQCVNVANEWAQLLRIEPFRGNAGSFFQDSHPNCDWIANTPTNCPHRGDIVEFEATPDGYIGVNGHVSVCIWGALDQFQSLDQNFPDGTPVHKQIHTYEGVAGWLRPKVLI